jgi:hypothetical protein
MQEALHVPSRLWRNPGGIDRRKPGLYGPALFDSGNLLMSPAMYILGLIGIAIVLCVILACGRKFLLSWYLREVRGLDLPADPSEAIVTYPLA